MILLNIFSSSSSYLSSDGRALALFTCAFVEISEASPSPPGWWGGTTPSPPALTLHHHSLVRRRSHRPCFLHQQLQRFARQLGQTRQFVGVEPSTCRTGAGSARRGPHPGGVDHPGSCHIWRNGHSCCIIPYIYASTKIRIKRFQPQSYPTHNQKIYQKISARYQEEHIKES